MIIGYCEKYEFWPQSEPEIRPLSDIMWSIHFECFTDDRRIFPLYDYLRSRYGSWITYQKHDHIIRIYLCFPEHYKQEATLIIDKLITIANSQLY
jgi:hypothetical protein